MHSRHNHMYVASLSGLLRRVVFTTKTKFGGDTVETVSANKKNQWTFQKWFRVTFISVGGVEVFFGVLSLIQGPKQLMSQFGIPEHVVNSPHYVDAMTWVVLHMTVLGTTLLTLGTLANEQRLQKSLTCIFLMFHFVYAFLDVRSSDNPLGTALYEGNASLIPAIMSSTFFLLFLNLALRCFLESSKPQSH